MNTQDPFKQSDLVTGVPEVKEGFIVVPERKGIEIDLVEGIKEKYPYKRRGINTRLGTDGSVIDQ